VVSRTRGLTEAAMKDLRPWKTLATREVYASLPWVRVLDDRLELPDGRIVESFHRILLPDYSMLFPILEDGRVLAIRCYRHGAGAVVLGFPGGGIDAGETPAEAARRELLEETGHVAALIEPIGSCFTGANIRGAMCHMFIARGCRQVAEPDSGDLEEQELVRYSREQIAAVLSENRFHILAHAAIAARALLEWKPE
jgi:ADP-ribose pyrophosphatase